MRPTATLSRRARLAALLSTLIAVARAQATWTEPEPRGLRGLRQVVLAMLAARSTRLLALTRTLLRLSRARTVKAVAMGLTSFLRRSESPCSASAPP
jgi:hypothetical protein